LIAAVASNCFFVKATDGTTELPPLAAPLESKPTLIFKGLSGGIDSLRFTPHEVGDERVRLLPNSIVCSPGSSFSLGVS
jgi:hypothetical protein